MTKKRNKANSRKTRNNSEKILLALLLYNIRATVRKESKKVMDRMDLSFFAGCPGSGLSG